MLRWDAGRRSIARLWALGCRRTLSILTPLSSDGPLRAMRAAQRDAELLQEQIGYINAHGSGTQVNDAMETCAIHKLFGGHAERLAISSTKSLHGHALGATGALEAVYDSGAEAWDASAYG
jgi:nodulation protein E